MVAVHGPTDRPNEGEALVREGKRRQLVPQEAADNLLGVGQWVQGHSTLSS